MKIADLNIKKVLDLATGHGQFIPYLLQENKGISEIIGIDICEKSLALAEKNFKDQEKVTFRKLDASSLPYENSSFDAVSINNSLHHFKDIDSVLKEAKRVLSSHGYLIVNEMTCDNGQNQAQQTHILLHHWFAELDRLMNRFHDNTYTSSKLINIVVTNGFELIKKETYNHNIDNPKDERIIENYTKIIKTTKEKLADKLPKEFIIKTEGIIKHLQEYGYSPARSIMMIAKKKEV